jgi:hypothetical protein
MKRWDQRPIEVRNLFNPAFCGLILLRSIQGYEEEDFSGMPFSLVLLVLPLCLHSESRRILASKSRSRLLKTVELNPELLVGFPHRAQTLLPFGLEALGFAHHLGCLRVTDDARLKSNPKQLRKTITGTSETVSCQKVARTVGRDFARIADRVTIYTSFGVRP